MQIQEVWYGTQDCISGSISQTPYLRWFRYWHNHLVSCHIHVDICYSTLSNWNKHILWWHKTMWCFQVSTNSIVFLWVNVWDKQTGLWLTKALFPVLLHSHVDYRRGSGQSQNVKLSKYMISPTKSRWQQSQ